MENTQTNTPEPQTLAATPSDLPIHKKNISLRILKILAIAVGSYLVIGLALIIIEPLSALIVFFPVIFINSLIQDMFIQDKRASLEGALENIPVSAIVLPSQLTQSDCVGLSHTPDFGNLSNPRIAPYVGQLGLKRFDNVGVCTTSQGNFVIKTSMVHVWIDLIEIYKESNGRLEKVLELENLFSEFTEDTDGTVFLLFPKRLEGEVTREVFMYEKTRKSISRVVQTGDVVKVCEREDSEQCIEWRFRNFPARQY